MIKQRVKIVLSYIKPWIIKPKKEKPVVINLLANDICNSKCTMCNIWKQKLDFEITSQELKTILTDNLYSNVRGIGITGGEPTMREDLIELYSACIEKLPKLESISIITNAIKNKEIFLKIKSINELANANKLIFTVMISLDGVGQVHDAHRGREGNFESAMQLVKDLRNINIEPIIGCTITKQNVWGVDDLYEFIGKNNLTGRFRIGEYITRLYNDDLKTEIRSFSEIETYHLSSFFTRISFDEKDSRVRRTYNNIVHMLNGGKREMGCPYQSKGIVLDSKGQIMYCAPKSKILGKALEKPSLSLYENHEPERKRILEQNCEDCIHDYHSEPTKIQGKKFFTRILWTQLLLNYKYFNITKYFIKNKSTEPQNSNYKVLIVGWYGTETVGDKAILGNIVDYYHEKFRGKVEITVASIIPFVTVQTLKELNLDLKIVETYTQEYVNSCATSDEVVMGGGPLMEIDDLIIPKSAFYIAKKYRKKTTIFGCGIGPLYTEKYIRITEDILSLADTIKLRDTKSIAWANKRGYKDIELYGDPARRYVVKRSKEIKSTVKENRLSCFLREWEPSYRGSFTKEEFNSKKEIFESNLAKIIKEFCVKNNVKPHFYCMHTFVVGGDDRIYYRSFLERYFSDTEYYLETYPSSVDQTIEVMKTSEYNLTMRFHSVLFAEVLETNFIGIDYTNGGKIKAYLEDNNLEHCLYSMDDIIDRQKELKFTN